MLLRPVRHDDLNGIVNALARISQRGRQFLERKCMRMISEASKRFSAINDAARCVALLPFASNSVDVDVISHNVWNVDHSPLMRTRQGRVTPAQEHMRGVVADGIGGTGTFEHVIDALAIRLAANGGDSIFSSGVDREIGAELAPDSQTAFARPD